MDKSATAAYVFAGFRLDLARRRLADATGRVLPLSARAFDVLAYLVEHRARVVSKDELLRSVWARMVVEENNLSQAVHNIRKALGDSRESPGFIATIPGRGFQFVAETRVDDADQSVPTLRPDAARQNPLPSSVAVLPFEPLVAGTASEALGLGIAETMINRLSELPGIVVSPLSSVRRRMDAGVDPLATGRALGVAAVLGGHLQVDQDRVRLTARLVDVSNGRSLWAGQFDERLGDVFVLQESLSNQVVRALSLDLSEAQRNRLARRDTADTEAWQLYLNGRYHWDRKSEDGMLRAIDCYEAAVRRDPTFALPYAGLADAYALLAVFHLRPPVMVFPRAGAAARRAIELDAGLAEAYASLGHVVTQYDRQLREGERLYRRALDLRPSCAQAAMWLANNLLMQGRVAEALAEARQAQKLEPMSLTFAANVGMVLGFAGRLDAAHDQLAGLVEAVPGFLLARHHLARVHVLRGQATEAIRLLEGCDGRAASGLSNLGRAYALAGRPGDARAEVSRLRSLGEQGFGVGCDVALILTALDEHEPALAALESMLADHSQPGFLMVEPGFDALRDHPRFRAVVQALGLT